MNIAIIGAGISGLSCTSALLLAGHQVDVFEKSRGVGGRMCTRKTVDWECDHGARYFTARDPAFRQQVATWQEAGTVALWTPRIAVYQDDLWSTASPTTERYVGVAQMNSPLKSMGIEVQTLSTIEGIERVDGYWRLTSKEGGLIANQYDALVLALPAPQARALLVNLDSPLASLAGGARMQGCWTMMMTFSSPPELAFDAAFINQGRLSWIADNRHKPQRTGLSTWVAHANTAWSEAHLEEDPNTVSAWMVEAFVELTGATPATQTMHRWRYASTAPDLDQQAAFDPAMNLGLCGDWLNGGRVEGAWLSGRKLAQYLTQ